MPTVSHPDFSASPVAGHCYACPADCDLPDMILCWLLHAIEKARGADERASKQSPRPGSRWRGTTERLSREPHVYLRSAVTRWPRCPPDRRVVPIQKRPMNAMNAYRLGLTPTFERQWHRPESQRQRQQTKGFNVAVIENTARVPEVSADFHILEIEDITLIDGIKFGTQDVPETRVQMQLRVRTPGESDETFNACMSTSLGDKATLGGIAQRGLGRDSQRAHVRHRRALSDGGSGTWSSHNERGWPKLVPGTAAPERKPRDAGDTEPPF